MTMSKETAMAKRSGARTLGIAFQILSAATLVGPFIRALNVAHLGTTIGVRSSQDPVVWGIVASGVFAALVLAGIGYALGMLCAIYDRQEPRAPLPREVQPVGPRRTFPSAPPPMENPSPGPSIKETSTWEFLTRERHLGKRRPRQD